MPDDAKIWNRMANRYAKQPVADPVSYERKLSETRALLGPQMDVLELGCGTGTTALKLAPCVRHIRATDVSGRMIEIAKGKARAAGAENVTFETAAADGLLSEDSRYDVIMAHSLLHLVPNRVEVIRGIHRTLKDGGYFISSTACLKGILPWLRVVLPVGRALGLFPGVSFFGAEDLLGEVKAAGFTVERHWQPGPKAALFVIARKA